MRAIIVIIRMPQLRYAVPYDLIKTTTKKKEKRSKAKDKKTQIYGNLMSSISMSHIDVFIFSSLNLNGPLAYLAIKSTFMYVLNTIQFKFDNCFEK